MKLRNISIEDEDLIKPLDQQPETTRFIGSLKGIYKAQYAKVIETDDGIFIGIVAITKSQAMDGTDWELLGAILEDFEGQGYATKACRILLNEVLSSTVNRVIGCVNRENKSSLALIKRLGGIFLQKRGEYHPNQDIYVFK